MLITIDWVRLPKVSPHSPCSSPPVAHLCRCCFPILCRPSWGFNLHAVYRQHCGVMALSHSFSTISGWVYIVEVQCHCCGLETRLSLTLSWWGLGRPPSCYTWRNLPCAVVSVARLLLVQILLHTPLHQLWWQDDHFQRWLNKALWVVCNHNRFQGHVNYLLWYRLLLTSFSCIIFDA